MTTLAPRRLLVPLLALAVLPVLTVLAAPPALAGVSHVAGPAVTRAADVVTGATVSSGVTELDGMRLNYLPAPLGHSTDFRYDDEGVDFVSRVWESRNPTGGWRVDLDVTVMRGARLGSGAALRRWLVAYQARDPQPGYTPIRLHGGPGWQCADQIFWLVRPGVAVSVRVDGSRWSGLSVQRTAAASDTSGL